MHIDDGLGSLLLNGSECQISNNKSIIKYLIIKTTDGKIPVLDVQSKLSKLYKNHKLLKYSSNVVNSTHFNKLTVFILLLPKLQHECCCST